MSREPGLKRGPGNALGEPQAENDFFPSRFVLFDWLVQGDRSPALPESGEVARQRGDVRPAAAAPELVSGYTQTERRNAPPVLEVVSRLPRGSGPIRDFVVSAPGLFQPLAEREPCVRLLVVGQIALGMEPSVLFDRLRFVRFQQIHRQVRHAEAAELLERLGEAL